MALNCVIGLKYGGAVMTGAMKKSNGGIQVRYCNYILNLDGEGAAPTIRLRRRGLGIACFLRNTRPKSDLGACGKGASSLHVKSRPLMWSTRRRGASPGRVLRAGGFTERETFFRKAGSTGKFHRCRSHWADTDPSQEKQYLEVQDEDGEKPSPGHRSGSRCDDWGAGCRSSRKGQAGPVREDL